MSDDPRWDPEMRAARQAMDAAAAQFPPVQLAEPLDQHQAVNDALQMRWVRGGPAMEMTEDLWIFARGRRVLCRLYRPKAAGVLPVLVWFHGGGWVWSSVDTHDRLVRELAAAGGVAALSVDYALSPEAKFPRAVLEATGVVRRLAVEAEAWGLDASRILLGGDSSGGNLALAGALALRDGGGPALKGLLAVYPVTDPDFGQPSYRECAEGYGLTTSMMRAYWDTYLRDPADRADPLAASARAELAGLPATLIQLAELDVLRSDCERMATRLRAAGVDCTSNVYPGMAHGFMRLTETVSRAREAVADAGGWLRRVGRELSGGRVLPAGRAVGCVRPVAPDSHRRDQRVQRRPGVQPAVPQRLATWAGAGERRRRRGGAPAGGDPPRQCRPAAGRGAHCRRPGERAAGRSADRRISFQCRLGGFGFCPPRHASVRRRRAADRCVGMGGGTATAFACGHPPTCRRRPGGHSRSAVARFWRSSGQRSGKGHLFRPCRRTAAPGCRGGAAGRAGHHLPAAAAAGPSGVGRTFQITGVFGSMTGRENVQMAPQAHHRRSWRCWQDAGSAFRDQALAVLIETGRVIWSGPISVRRP